MNIIGLGQAACNVATYFKNLPQYRVFYIDSTQPRYEGAFLKVDEMSDHEAYEQNYKKLNMRKVPKQETTLVVTGGSRISGITLRLLEQLKNRTINILYIKPDLSTSPRSVVMQERLTFGILQQYTRSGLLKNIYVVENEKIEAVLKTINIADYWQSINNVISSTYNMINVFENTEPLLSNLVSPGKTSKIATFGVVDFASFEEQMFYELTSPRLKQYFFGISEKTLNEKKDLLPNIRSYLKSKSEQECSTCFAIYSTDYEQDYVYTVHYASRIQEENI